MKDRKEILFSIMEKAAQDNEFRADLLADARSAIGKEFDIQVPEGINIVVHENDSSTVHLPVPPKPEVLSEGDLRQVSGGITGQCACM